YNNLERSYLYSPCYDISTLHNPMLSFSAALDIEDCGKTLCDRAFVEYTLDGVNWQKLGLSGQGTNWYDATYQAWTRNDFTRWHVASIPIPHPSSVTVVSFRFGLNSDPGATFEGFAIDDVHIYDLDAAIATPAAPMAATRDIAGNTWQPFLYGGSLVASLNARNQVLNGVTATAYSLDTFFFAAGGQYYIPRNHTISLPFSPADSFACRLYMTDDELLRVLQDTNCRTCIPITDAYRLGVTQYVNNNNHSLENQRLYDDTGGQFTFTPAGAVQWVPYDKGYYVQLATRQQGEFWFNPGGPAQNVPVHLAPVQLVAFMEGTNATLIWQSVIDTLVDSYFVERSVDDVLYSSINDTPARNLPVIQYRYQESSLTFSSTKQYYRIRYHLKNNTQSYYSNTCTVHIDNQSANGMTLTAEMETATTVRVGWIAGIDPLATHYYVERATEGNSFVQIGDRASFRLADKQYSLLDQPEGVRAGNTIKYRVKALMAYGDTLTSDISTVTWGMPNTVTEIYPNPTTDGKVTITWFAPAGAVLQVALYTATGQRILETNTRATGFYNTTLLDAGMRGKGLYLLQTEVNGNRQTHKIVVK
ncbi:MAG: T9SS C-terminal target domain-containing protein, partial [Chitinophagia bacterium]|nr:T9SS C-terminal target domain-containing protein [Chitinophagia bacterium]